MTAVLPFRRLAVDPRRWTGLKAGMLIASPMMTILICLAIGSLRGSGDVSGWIFLAGVVMTCAALSGCLFGPARWLVPRRRAVASILAMTGTTVTLGAYLVALGIAIKITLDNGSHGSLDQAVRDTVILGSIGLVWLGLPAAVLVLPHAVAWRWLMRRWVGDA